MSSHIATDNHDITGEEIVHISEGNLISPNAEQESTFASTSQINEGLQTSSSITQRRVSINTEHTIIQVEDNKENANDTVIDIPENYPDKQVQDLIENYENNYVEYLRKTKGLHKPSLSVIATHSIKQVEREENRASISSFFGGMFKILKPLTSFFITPYDDKLPKLKLSYDTMIFKSKLKHFVDITKEIDKRKTGVYRVETNYYNEIKDEQLLDEQEVLEQEIDSYLESITTQQLLIDENSNLASKSVTKIIISGGKSLLTLGVGISVVFLGQAHAAVTVLGLVAGAADWVANGINVSESNQKRDQLQQSIKQQGSQSSNVILDKAQQQSPMESRRNGSFSTILPTQPMQQGSQYYATANVVQTSNVNRRGSIPENDNVNELNDKLWRYFLMNLEIDFSRPYKLDKNNEELSEISNIKYDIEYCIKNNKSGVIKLNYIDNTKNIVLGLFIDGANKKVIYINPINIQLNQQIRQYVTEELNNIEFRNLYNDFSYVVKTEEGDRSEWYVIDNIFNLVDSQPTPVTTNFQTVQDNVYLKIKFLNEQIQSQSQQRQV